LSIIYIIFGLIVCNSLKDAAEAMLNITIQTPTDLVASEELFKSSSKISID